MAGAVKHSGPVICFGEVLLRLAPRDARLMVQAGTLDLDVGGAEANVAAALASLGHDTQMVTLLPDSPLGAKARAALGSAGVGTRFVASKPGRMGLYFLEPGAGLRPSSITYDRAGSAFALAQVEDFDLAGAMQGASLLHMSGITPALGPNGVALAFAALSAAKTAGVPVCFDGNYRALLRDAWDSDPRSILTEVVSAATVLIGNHRDISLLLGKTFSGDGATRRREAVDAAFAAFPNLQLVASTARHVASSDHHRLAARVDTRAGKYQTAEIDVTGIVDRIGTGDAFAAGVLHQWLQGGDEQAMAESGLALAALKHSQPGDMCLIGKGELAAFSASGGDVRR